MTKYMIEFRVEDDGNDEGPRVKEIADRLRSELPDAEDVRVTALDDEDVVLVVEEEG